MRCWRAHPGAVSIKAQKTENDEPELTVAEQHERDLARLLDAIPPDGATLAELAALTGKDAETMRRWTVTLQRQGKVTRESIGGNSAVRIRRVEG